jgi:hypothetical protein
MTMTQPAAYARYSQRVWTNANLAKDFVKVKTYSDLISSYGQTKVEQSNG